MLELPEVLLVEDAFGELQGDLNACPVFHWADQRIMGYLVLCFLAYLCEALMTKALRQKSWWLESRVVENEIIKPRPLWRRWVRVAQCTSL